MICLRNKAITKIKASNSIKIRVTNKGKKIKTPETTKVSRVLVTRCAWRSNTFGRSVHLHQCDRAVVPGVVEGDRHPIIIDKHCVDKDVNDPPLALRLIKIKGAEL